MAGLLKARKRPHEPMLAVIFDLLWEICRNCSNEDPLELIFSVLAIWDMIPSPAHAGCSGAHSTFVMGELVAGVMEGIQRYCQFGVVRTFGGKALTLFCRFAVARLSMLGGEENQQQCIHSGIYNQYLPRPERLVNATYGGSTADRRYALIASLWKDVQGCLPVDKQESESEPSEECQAELEIFVDRQIRMFPRRSNKMRPRLDALSLDPELGFRLERDLIFGVDAAWHRVHSTTHDFVFRVLLQEHREQWVDTDKRMEVVRECFKAADDNGKQLFICDDVNHDTRLRKLSIDDGSHLRDLVDRFDLIFQTRFCKTLWCGGDPLTDADSDLCWFCKRDQETG